MQPSFTIHKATDGGETTGIATFSRRTSPSEEQSRNAKAALSAQNV